MTLKQDFINFLLKQHLLTCFLLAEKNGLEKGVVQSEIQLALTRKRKVAETEKSLMMSVQSPITTNIAEKPLHMRLSRNTKNRLIHQRNFYLGMTFSTFCPLQEHFEPKITLNWIKSIKIQEPKLYNRPKNQIRMTQIL